MKFARLKCPKCGVESSWPFWATKNYYDFVCHCGYGKRWNAEDIYAHEMVCDSPVAPIHIECSELSCERLTPVQAIAREGSGEPISPVSEWELDGIYCPNDHLLTEPYIRRKSIWQVSS